MSRVESAPLEDIVDLTNTMSAYPIHQPVSLAAAPDCPSISPKYVEIRKAKTEELDNLSVGRSRPGSSLSVHEDSSGGIKQNSRWFRRFSRGGSNNRLAKALESPEFDAHTTNHGKLYNPFSRRRSIPAVHRVKQTILGQTAKKAIETGGHASNSSKLLPNSLLPMSPVEVPYIVDTCVSWLIENKAHMTPGIFRINGSDKAVRAIIDHFSAGSVRMPLEDIDLPDGQLISVHDVASCLKKFLVLMPGGLLGESVFETLSAISDEAETNTDASIARDIGEAFQSVKDRPKFHVVLVLMALLRYIADQSRQLGMHDDPKQDTGFMTAFSLSIVFSPTCLGTRDASSAMRRSSTSYSDRSIQSDSTTPIEEAVAAARLGSKVLQMLISSWTDVVPYLASGLEYGGLDDSVAMLEIVSLPIMQHEEIKIARPLQTILDSPNKDNVSLLLRQSTHTRSESIDTVTQKRVCDCQSTILLKDAQMDIQQSKIKLLENLNDELSQALREKSDETARLFARVLDLERENNRLMASNIDPSKHQ